MPWLRNSCAPSDRAASHGSTCPWGEARAAPIVINFQGFLRSIFPLIPCSNQSYVPERDLVVPEKMKLTRLDNLALRVTLSQLLSSSDMGPVQVRKRFKGSTMRCSNTATYPRDKAREQHVHLNLVAGQSTLHRMLLPRRRPRRDGGCPDLLSSMLLPENQPVRSRHPTCSYTLLA